MASLAGHTVRIAHTLIGLGGAAMLSWGVAMIYTPAGWICGGAALLEAARELAGARAVQAVAPAPAAAQQVR